MKKILLGGMVVGVALCWVAQSAQAQTANATANSPLYNPGTNSLSMDLYGNLRSSSDSGVPTYSAIATFTPVAGIVGEICGSASKTITLRNLSMDGWVPLAGTAGGMTVVVHRLSSADAGGTPVAVNKPSYVVGNPTTTALVQGYTAAPSTGTSLGSIYSGTVNFPILGNDTPKSVLPATAFTQPITLAGASQCVDMTIAGTVPTTPTLSIGWTWTEQ